MDNGLLEYLNGVPPNSLGDAWVLVSKVEEDTGLSRLRIFDEVVEGHENGFVGNVRTLEPGLNGLLSVTITERARAWLRGEDWTRLPMPYLNKLVYGFDRK